jgi:prolyl-tRNA editing enzyme YbaK/EbsC (Cys-tRNA(Pro) deacylase)
MAPSELLREGLAALALDGAGAGGAAAAGRATTLAARQAALLERIARLEAAPGAIRAPPAPAGTAPAAAAAADDDPAAGPTQRRLAAELRARGVAAFRFARAPSEYYDRPLEFRRAVVGAASVQHLCKTIIFTNTKISEEEAAAKGVDKVSAALWMVDQLDGEGDAKVTNHPTNQTDPPRSFLLYYKQYFAVIVQYTARLDTEKLRNHVHAAARGALSRKAVNMRLCPEDVSAALTGCGHNAVSPVGLPQPLPLLLSDRVAALSPDEFWLGAGEVDLKLGLSATEFVRAYAPTVLDCTAEGVFGGEEGE